MSMVKHADFRVLSARMSSVPSPGEGLRKTADRWAPEYEARKGYLYVRSRAISSRTNDNWDTFPAAEIAKAYRTFVGKPVFVNHHNADHRRARGVIIDAYLHEDVTADGAPDTWVEVLMEIDAITFPKLAEAILKGRIDRTSMGCFPPGTRITLPDGSGRRIEDIRVGDRVLTKDGGSGEVSYVMERDYDGLVYDLKVFGQSTSFMATDEHPVWVRRDMDAPRNKVTGRVKTNVSTECSCGRTFETPRSLGAHIRESVRREYEGLHERVRVERGVFEGWVEACEVRPGDWVKTPSPEKGEQKDVSHALARLVGFWAAEGNLGWDRKRRPDGPVSVEWSFSAEPGRDEMHLVEEVQQHLRSLGLTPAGPYVKNNAYSIRCNSPEFADEMQRLVGSLSWNKRFAPEVMRWSSDRHFDLFSAWVHGDGSFRENQHFEAVTTSQVMAEQLHLIAISAGVNCTPPARQHSPAIQEAGNRPLWHIQGRLEGTRPVQAYVEDGHLWRRVNNVVVKTYQGPVYNFEVPGDHSYVAADVAVHNCNVTISTCSVCGNRATDITEFCDHVKRHKGKRIVRTDPDTGERESVLVTEICEGLSFFENSLLVEDPADPTAVFTGVDDHSGVQADASKTESGRDTFASAAGSGMPGLKLTYSKGVYHGRPNPEMDWVIATVDGEQVGYLGWWTTSESAEGWDPGHEVGEIISVQVDDVHRRKGIASAMIDMARQVEPRVHHSDTLTDEGRAWAEKTARVGSVMSWYPGGRERVLGFNWDTERFVPESQAQTSHRWTMRYLTNPLGMQAIETRRGTDPDRGQVEGFLTWKDGVIDFVRVENMRRSGLATFMLEFAREITPGLQHSDRLLPDGEAWALAVGSLGRKTASSGIRYTHEPSRSEYGGLSITNPRMVAYDGEREVGSLDWDAHRPALFGTVRVSPAYRRRGIATRLWEEAKKVNPLLDPESSVFFTPDGRAFVDSLGKTASRDLFHGTSVPLSPGARIVPSRPLDDPEGWDTTQAPRIPGERHSDPSVAYATSSEDDAWFWAEHSWNAGRGDRPRVYRVRALGPTYPDPNNEFAGDVVSPVGFEVVDEVTTGGDFEFWKDASLVQVAQNGLTFTHHPGHFFSKDETLKPADGIRIDTMLAEDPSGLVGVLSWYPGGFMSGGVDALWVRPDRRRQGVATALLSEVRKIVPDLDPYQTPWITDDGSAFLSAVGTLRTAFNFGEAALAYEQVRRAARALSMSQATTLTRRVLTDAGFPRGDQAEAVPHPSGRGTSSVAWDLNEGLGAIPLVALADDMRNEFTVLHECAHILRNGPQMAGRQSRGTDYGHDNGHDQRWWDTLTRLVGMYATPLFANAFRALVLRDIDPGLLRESAKTAMPDDQGWWYHFGTGMERYLEGQYAHLGTRKAAEDRMENTRSSGRGGSLLRAKINPRNPLGSPTNPMTDDEVNILTIWEGEVQSPGEMPTPENGGDEVPWHYHGVSKETPMSIAARWGYRGAWRHDAFFYLNKVEDKGSVSVAVDPDAITEQDDAPPRNPFGNDQLLLWGQRTAAVVPFPGETIYRGLALPWSTIENLLGMSLEEFEDAPDADVAGMLIDVFDGTGAGRHWSTVYNVSYGFANDVAAQIDGLPVVLEGTYEDGMAIEDDEVLLDEWNVYTDPRNSEKEVTLHESEAVKIHKVYWGTPAGRWKETTSPAWGNMVSVASAQSSRGPQVQTYPVLSGGKYHVRRDPVVEVALCRGTIVLDVAASPIMADPAGKAHPIVCRRCLDKHRLESIASRTLHHGYRGGHQPYEGGPPLHDLLQDGSAPRDVYDNPHYYTGFANQQAGREAIDVIHRVRGNPDAMVTIYRSLPPNVPQQIEPGNWISLSRSYALMHGMDRGWDEWVEPKVPNVFEEGEGWVRREDDWPVISRQVPAWQVRWDVNDLVEMGWFPNAPRTASLGYYMNEHRIMERLGRDHDLLKPRTASTLERLAQEVLDFNGTGLKVNLTLIDGDWSETPSPDWGRGTADILISRQPQNRTKWTVLHEVSHILAEERGTPDIENETHGAEFRGIFFGEVLPRYGYTGGYTATRRDVIARTGSLHVETFDGRRGERGHITQTAMHDVQGDVYLLTDNPGLMDLILDLSEREFIDVQVWERDGRVHCRIDAENFSVVTMWADDDQTFLGAHTPDEQTFSELDDLRESLGLADSLAVESGPEEKWIMTGSTDRLSPNQLDRLASVALDPCPECGSDNVSIIDYGDNLHECGDCSARWDSTTIWGPEQYQGSKIAAAVSEESREWARSMDDDELLWEWNSAVSAYGRHPNSFSPEEESLPLVEEAQRRGITLPGYDPNSPMLQPSEDDYDERYDQGDYGAWNHGPRFASREAARLSPAQLQALALGEQRSPAEVDTLRDEACPVCGSVDFQGSTCSACGYAKSPVIFHDPNVDKAKSEDLRTPTAPVDLACDSCGAVYPAPSGVTASRRKVADTIPSPPPLPGQESSPEVQPAQDEPTTTSPAAPSTEHERGDVCPSCGQGTLLPKDEVDGVEADEVEGFDSEGDPVGDGDDVEDDEFPEDADDNEGEDVEGEDDDDALDDESDDDLSDDEDDPTEGVESPGRKSRTSQKEKSMTNRQTHERYRGKPQRSQASRQRPNRPPLTRTAVQECNWTYSGEDDGGNLHWWDCTTHDTQEVGGPPGEPPHFNCEKYFEEYNAENPYTGSRRERPNASGQERRRLMQAMAEQSEQVRALTRLLRRQAATSAILSRENHQIRQAVLTLASQAGNKAVVASLDPHRANAAENNDDVALTDEQAVAPEARVDVESPGGAAATDSVTPDATTDVENEQVALDTKPLNELVDVTQEHNDVGEPTGTTTDYTGPAKSAPENNPIEESGWKTSSTSGERTWATMRLAKMRKDAGLTDEEPTSLAQRLASDESVTMDAIEAEIRTLKAVAGRKEASAPSQEQRRHLVPRGASQVPSLTGTASASSSSGDGVNLEDTIY